VRDLTLQKRAAPELFKALLHDRAESIWRWEVAQDRIQRHHSVHKSTGF